MKARFPAEWEPQDGILLGWPHENTDWANCLEKVETVFIEIVKQIIPYEKVIIPVPDKNKVISLLQKENLNLNQIQIYEMPTNDTWARDYGFLTLIRNNQAELLDFGFNGWGLKFASCHDNQINRNLMKNQDFSGAPLKTMKLILEGGSIESDGRGILLTTSECLLSYNRNPYLSKEEITQELINCFKAQKILWLDHGFLSGDDTDSHIDTLARLCPDNTILYVSCDNPKDEHYQELQLMKKQLESFTNLKKKSFKLIPLPFPKAKFDTDGNRLPATYANYLVINHAVLVPTYEDEQDKEALETIGKVFPDRKIIGINCLPIIEQHGSLHCLTMQIPKGVLL